MFSRALSLPTIVSFVLCVDVAYGTNVNALHNNPSQFLQATVNALGGIDVLNNITSFSYEALTIYRSQPLSQSYGVKRSDRSVSAAGSQVMSFAERNGSLLERIDRSYLYGEYWIFSHPDLTPPMNYSVVVQDGLDGFACFNQGQNNFYASDPTVALGFADAYLTDYLVQQAHQFAIPWLIKQFVAANSSLAFEQIEDPLTGVELSGLTHPTLNLTLVIDNKTSLPHMVRSNEQHKIFGNSTSDLILSNYSSFGSALLPQRFQTVYNSYNMIEDFFADTIILDPSFPSTYFSPTSTNTTRAAPSQSIVYPRSEVHEFFETALWEGPSPYNISSVVVEYPIPSLPAIRSIHVGEADYFQLLVEFSFGLLITDASPFQSRTILDWVAQNYPNKSVTHVVPSHHHRDHAGGVDDYIAAGAQLVVPEVAKTYYANVDSGNVEFITYNDSQPFLLDDGNVQFRSFWRDENPHAVDWSYGLATASCPGNDTGTVVFVADVVNPGLSGDGFSTANALRWDAGYARQWVLAAVQDRVPSSATVLGAHGSSFVNGVSSVMGLDQVADITGVLYPDIGLEGLKSTSRN